VCNQLGLVWGVTPALIDEINNTDCMTLTAVSNAVKLHLARSGDTVVITSGNPAGPPGNTNLLTVEQVEEEK
jgi:pyruvate kinase